MNKAIQNKRLAYMAFSAVYPLYLAKVVDELAKGRKLEKIFRESLDLILTAYPSCKNLLACPLAICHRSHIEREKLQQLAKSRSESREEISH